MAPRHVTDFVRQLTPMAVEIGDRYGIDPALIITQAAIESGWGEKVSGNNYFGVKSHGQPGGQSITTHEEIGGKRVKVQDDFRVYDSLAGSMEDYAKFLSTNPRYGDVFKTRDLNKQIDAIASSGYATDSKYPGLLRDVSRMVTREMGPMPPAQIPNTVATQLDTQRPPVMGYAPSRASAPQIEGRSSAPTSAASRQVPTNWFTPRLAPGNGDIYSYHIPDQTPTSVVGGLGSLTPDRSPPPLPRLDPRLPSRMDLAAGPASTPRAVSGFPTPLPGYQSGPQVRLPEIAASPGYNRMDAMAGIPSNAMRQELALQGQSYAGMDRTPSSGVGRPPTTRTVPSVPVRPTQTAAVDGVGYMPTMGLMRATLGSTPKPLPAPTPTTAIPGPNALPKGNEQLVAGIYPPEPVPSALPAVGAAIDVVPQVIPGVPIGPGLPPAPRPRPLRSGVNVQMPTPMGQRPTLPMPRPVTGFPTALAQRPIPAPTLRIAVNGANSYNAGSSGGSSGGSQPQTIRGSSTGREYNVGQQYQAGGYRFEAKPDGTFKNLGRI